MDKLTKKETKHIIKIGDKDYELSPINWNVLSGIEEELECSIAGLVPLFQKSLYKSTLKLAWVLLRDKYPELTQEQIGAIKEHKEILVISNVISEILLDFFKGE